MKSITKFCSFCLLKVSLIHSFSLPVTSTLVQGSHSLPWLMYFSWYPYLLSFSPPTYHIQKTQIWLCNPLLQYFQGHCLLDLTSNDFITLCDLAHLCLRSYLASLSLVFYNLHWISLHFGPCHIPSHIKGLLICWFLLWTLSYSPLLICLIYAFHDSLLHTCLHVYTPQTYILSSKIEKVPLFRHLLLPLPHNFLYCVFQCVFPPINRKFQKVGNCVLFPITYWMLIKMPAVC